MRTTLLLWLLFVSSVTAAGWETAWAKGPLSADETRTFLKELSKYVEDNHLKKDPKSPQRGMVYEYFDPKRKGQVDQWVQGEALDTMHDGAWLAAALATAHRVTGDAYYKELLTRWQLPFYCKMLNHSDTLFSAKRDDSREKGHRFNKEHAMQEGEKGFVPYWWDDGASVSLERRRDKNPLAAFSCTDLLKGQPNPDFRLSGYSHGSSNHLAQDLGVMLVTSWLLLKDSKDKDDLRLAKEVALAAKHLHECRMRHHGHIPMCDAPSALANADAKLMKHVPGGDAKALWTPSNHYTRALYDYKPGQRYAFPGFADDTQYRYYAALAKHGGKLPDAIAFKLVYDAFTEPKLYQQYRTDVRPPGINRFDLHPYHCRDGRPEDYSNDRKGPFNKERPIGSRMGPQSMVCCGWALQLLKERPGLWEKRYHAEFAKDTLVRIDEPSLRGKEEQKYSSPIKFDGVTVELTNNGASLQVRGVCTNPTLTLEIFSRPDAKGSFVKVVVPASKDYSVENDQGKGLANVAVVRGSNGFEKGFQYSLLLPWTMYWGQRTAWANGVEHGRYSIRVGKEVRNFYLASSEEQVTRWLRQELGAGLRTWRAIFREKGYIPTGIGAGDWDRFSDSGGYAHLIAACAQWLLVLEGKNDWSLHNVPALP